MPNKGNPSLIVRVDPQLQADVQAAAAAADLSVADWHRRALERQVKAEAARTRRRTA